MFFKLWALFRTRKILGKGKKHVGIRSEETRWTAKLQELLEPFKVQVESEDLYGKIVE